MEFTIPLLTLLTIIAVGYIFRNEFKQVKTNFKDLNERIEDLEDEVEEGVETDKLTSAVAQSWKELNLDKEIGQIEKEAERIEDLHTNIVQMMRNPRERGEFGEVKLDTLLSNHLPQDMYGIREQVIDGKTPDAYIQASTGKVCIDSKFPLENYEKYLNAETDKEKQKYHKKFRRDVEKQLKQIKKKYVKPESGTAEFAFQFIPSEQVYYHLVKEEYTLLNKYTQQGVQVVSPLTLGHKLEIIKSDIQTQKLSEQAKEVKNTLNQLETRFEEFDEDWETLLRHLRNAKNKSEDVDNKYQNLKTEFNQTNQI